ncbi:MAG TPA: hypothetical protein VIG24_05325 [Acidimicrobiia bacterium]
MDSGASRPNPELRPAADAQALATGLFVEEKDDAGATMAAAIRA